MSPESGSREPVTEAGRWLFTDNEPLDMMESDGVTPGDIRRVESEAVERFAEALVRAVEELEKDPERDYEDVSWNAAIAAILDAISALRSPADTGEHQEGDVGS